jgi:radical SAM superfamily enzyme YgiQ (UPF0313 family)
MQISRGCPYQCEFCDIIITFGRRPRLKTSEQVITELNTFLDANLRMVFVVDDNLIGNKKAIKPILRDIIAWQQERAYPLTLFTEASLDLAEDEELMQLMGEANFQAVFVGIESPNEDSLQETKKYQNVRPKAGTVMERIHRIQEHGLELWCGMILGFDHDETSIFEIMPEFIQQSRIVHALIGQLYAIPTTPLYARLKEEDRLDESGGYFGLGVETNVVPLRMSAQDLREGYIEVMQRVYNPTTYFDRIDSLFLDARFKYRAHTLPYWRKHRVAWAKRCAMNVARTMYLYRRVMRAIRDKEMRSEYRRRFWRLVRSRPREPHLWLHYIIKITMHHHYWTMILGMKAGLKELVRSPERVSST